MKYFALFTGMLILLYFCGFGKKVSIKVFMDRNFTTAIKGFSIGTVVWSHVGGCLGIGGIQFIAGIGVCLFLICSGYGLEISYQKNGLKGFWIKRLISSIVPFWVVEFIGLISVNYFTVDRYLLDISFLKAATSYGWFMQYILICYILFYLVKRFVKQKNMQIPVICVLFAFWFVAESIYFANPNMPALKARQMLSFPCGIFIAKNRDKLISTFKNKTYLYILAWVGTGIAFMGITQFSVVKEMPYLLSNILSLFTVLPLGVVVLIIGWRYQKLFENVVLNRVGVVSFEIYLVHAFTLVIVKTNVLNICEFIVITTVLAVLLHTVIKFVNEAIRGKING